MYVECSECKNGIKKSTAEGEIGKCSYEGCNKYLCNEHSYYIPDDTLGDKRYCKEHYEIDKDDPWL